MSKGKREETKNESSHESACSTQGSSLSPRLLEITAAIRLLQYWCFRCVGLKFTLCWQTERPRSQSNQTDLLQSDRETQEERWERGWHPTDTHRRHIQVWHSFHTLYQYQSVGTHHLNLSVSPQRWACPEWRWDFRDVDWSVVGGSAHFLHHQRMARLLPGTRLWAAKTLLQRTEGSVWRKPATHHPRTGQAPPQHTALPISTWFCSATPTHSTGYFDTWDFIQIWGRLSPGFEPGHKLLGFMYMHRKKHETRTRMACIS